MGKTDSEKNIPTNSSLSMTLNSRCTIAELELFSEESASVPGESAVEWVPELPRYLDSSDLSDSLDSSVPQLTSRDRSRMVRHIERVWDLVPEVFDRVGLKFRPGFLKNRKLRGFLRTANTFPASSGIASSASSFAAVTLAVAAGCAEDLRQFERHWEEDLSLRIGLAQISRQGSGSSCRSFFGPWVEWSPKAISVVNAEKMPPIAHFVILVKTQPKKVSSSEAHLAVQTSPLWEGRVERAEQRVIRVEAALQAGDLKALSQLSWAESWEMHSLFHTCAEPFTYWEPGTIEGLHFLAGFLKEEFPPLVTLDAGPNLHVMVRWEDRELWRSRLAQFFSTRKILEDGQGTGPVFLKAEGGGSA
jgi:diphosphomevalonate decarboxylase